MMKIKKEDRKQEVFLLSVLLKTPARSLIHVEMKGVISPKEGLFILRKLQKDGFKMRRKREDPSQEVSSLSILLRINPRSLIHLENKLVACPKESHYILSKLLTHGFKMRRKREDLSQEESSSSIILMINLRSSIHVIEM